jgi:TonB family protein
VRCKSSFQEKRLIIAAQAMAPEEAYVAQYRDTPLKTPVPMTVVSPAVGSQYIGATVRLEFVVDALGKTVESSITSTPDDVLATAVVKAVKQWRFLPAEIDGKTVATKVALPVRIADTPVNGQSSGSNN